MAPENVSYTRVSNSPPVMDHANEDYNAPTTDQAQPLLQALQNYIVPLVVNASNGQHGNVGQAPGIPEAGKFLSALQDFILSIVRSQSVYKDSIEVDLEGDEAKVDNPSTALIAQRGEDTIGALIQTRKPPFLNRILSELRERIYNEMPIRLLHITPHGSKVQIRLLERNQIYDELAGNIEAEYTDAKFRSKVERERATSGETQSSTLEKNVIKDWVSACASYAILSHTWIRAPGGEVTYESYRKSGFISRSQEVGLKKLVNFCKVTAVNHKLSLAWMDTICINKESSSELDESIRSMYKWYKNSAICITYLAGTTEFSKMHQDTWFTRGWTLQELLAPDIIQFYDADWHPLNKMIGTNDKDNGDIQAQINKAIMITPAELDLPSNMPISRIMQLAAKREVMREEDTAYSLMGICGVSIAIAYGEGWKYAFTRLLTAVLNTSNRVLDIFNCAQNRYSLLPSSPWAYIRRSTKLKGLNWQRPIEPLLLTHLGLRIPILLMPSVQEDDPNFKNDPIGDYHGTVDFPKPWYSRYTGHYRVLDKGTMIAPTQDDTYHTTFGVINFGLGGDKTTLGVPDTCLAVNFQSRWNVEWEPPAPSIKRLATQQPIIFELINKNNPSVFYLINRSELAAHGMTLVTMYL